jgi:hypothetical protein
MFDDLDEQQRAAVTPALDKIKRDRDTLSARAKRIFDDALDSYRKQTRGES